MTSMVAAPESSTLLLIPKHTIEHDPKSFLSTSHPQNLLSKIQLHVILPSPYSSKQLSAKDFPTIILYTVIVYHNIATCPVS